MWHKPTDHSFFTWETYYRCERQVPVCLRALQNVLDELINSYIYTIRVKNNYWLQHLFGDIIQIAMDTCTCTIWQHNLPVSPCCKHGGRSINHRITSCDWILVTLLLCDVRWLTTAYSLHYSLYTMLVTCLYKCRIPSFCL